MSGDPHTGLFVPQILLASAGLLILGGLWTQAAGTLAGMVEVWLALTEPGIQLMALLLAGVAISLAMIGPGVWSIDARLYGRKQVLPSNP